MKFRLLFRIVDSEMGAAAFLPGQGAAGNRISDVPHTAKLKKGTVWIRANLQPGALVLPLVLSRLDSQKDSLIMFMQMKHVLYFRD